MPEINFITILKKWWLFIGLVSIISVIFAFVLIIDMPPTYKSSTKIFVSTGLDLSIANTNDAPYADRAIKTVSVLINSNTLEKSIADKTGATTTNLDKNLKVKGITGAQLVEIDYSDKSAALVSNVLTVLPSELSSYLQDLQQSAESKNQIQISVAEKPSAPTQNSSLKIQILTIVFLCALFLTYLIAYLIENFDNTFKSDFDVDSLGINHLGDFGILKKFKDNPSAIVQEENILVGEMMRQIRTNINFLNTNKNIRTLVITSAKPREGKTLLVSNLAIMLAESGKKVVLVDADLHAPMINKVFGIVLKKGLSEYLYSLADINEVVFKSQFKNLWLVGPGKKVSAPGIALSNTVKITELIEQLASADYILFDTPPLGMISDASVLAQLADGVILAIEKEKTTLKDVQNIINKLAKINGKIIGGILTKSKENQKAYYYADKNK